MCCAGCRRRVCKIVSVVIIAVCILVMFVHQASDSLKRDRTVLCTNVCGYIWTVGIVFTW